MKQRYSVFLRPWGVCYYEDHTTGKQKTLKTRDKDEAFRLVAAKNEHQEARHSAAIWFAAFNAVTFLVFGFDKWSAQRSGWHVSESILVMLGVLGGWPGGLLGMIVFRHKTAKWTFKFKYALALIPFITEILVWLHWG
jgi:uncharacterized membrane protein YsdA (DUF1294 family)